MSLDNCFILSTIHNSRRYQNYFQYYEVIKYFQHCSHPLPFVFLQVTLVFPSALEALSFYLLFSLVPFSFSEPVLKKCFWISVKHNSFWICSYFSIRFCSLWRIAYLLALVKRSLLVKRSSFSFLKWGILWTHLLFSSYPFYDIQKWALFFPVIFKFKCHTDKFYVHYF